MRRAAIELGFPHDFYWLEMVKGTVYGGMRDQILADGAGGTYCTDHSDVV